MAKKTAGGKLLAGPANLETLQRDAQALVKRLRKEALRFSQDQKRALDRIAGEGRRLRGDFDAFVKRTSKDLESRSKRLLSTVEKEAEKALSRLWSD